MPNGEVNIAELDQAEAALLETKEAARRSGASDSDRQAYQEAAQRLSDVRRAYREQEEAAGNRAGFVAGDVETTEG